MSENFITRLQFPFTFDQERLKEDLEIALQNNWISHYNKRDYAGEWDLIALMSAGGDAATVVAQPVKQLPVVETEILHQCHYFREVIESFLFEKTTVRLMRLKVGAEIKPHTDNCLGYEDGAFRIHIPVVTNPDVEFILAGERVLMEEGTCWYINANETHSVANRGSEDRVHLVIDGIRNEWTDELFFAQAPPERFNRPPREISVEQKKMMIESLKHHDNEASRELIARLTAEIG